MADLGHLNDALRMGEATQEAAPRSSALAELGWSHYGDRHGGLGMIYGLLGRGDEARARYERARSISHVTGHFSTHAVTTYQQLKYVSIPYRTEHLAEHEQLVAESNAAIARTAGSVDSVFRRCRRSCV